jgi:hypothetical protein
MFRIAENPKRSDRFCLQTPPLQALSDGPAALAAPMRCVNGSAGGPRGPRFETARGRGGGTDAPSVGYFSSQMVVVLLTSFDTMSSALPVGLCAAGTKVRPSGPRSPQLPLSVQATKPPLELRGNLRLFA